MQTVRVNKALMLQQNYSAFPFASPRAYYLIDFNIVENANVTRERTLNVFNATNDKVF